MKFGRAILILILFGSLLSLSCFTVHCSSAAPAAAAAEPLGRIHWLGMNQISTDSNAAEFLKVWHLPETTALLTQTLDKTSCWLGGADGTTNSTPASTLIRPLLDDLVSCEAFLEIDTTTNSPRKSLAGSQLLAALRLPPSRARLWLTNLAALAAANPTIGLEFERSGEWTLVSLGKGQGAAALRVFAARLPNRGSATRSTRTTTNLWFEADLDPSRLAEVISPERGSVTRSTAGPTNTVADTLVSLFALNHQLSAINSFRVSISSESSNLLTLATLDFNRPLHLTLPPWDIPTNLIHGPLTSFTAVRGLAPWLVSLPAWQKLGLTPPPEQAFWWSHAVIPLQTYFAAPLPAASNQLARIAPRLIRDANPWLATHADGSIAWNETPPGILWNGANLLNPFLVAMDSNHHDYLLAGLYPPSAPIPERPPLRVLDALQHQPNLLFCQLEGTGTRVEDGLFMIQLFRMVFHKPQMPATAAGTLWLKKSEQLFGESFTVITRATPSQWVLVRHSTTGLTALELHLLADWLESPQFPHGLHTFLAPPDQ